MDKATLKTPLLIVGSTTLGAVAGYFFAKKRLESKYQAILDEEINSVKEHYAKRNKEGVFFTPESAVEALVPGARIPAARRLVEDILARESYVTDDESEVEAPENVRNIFDREDADLDSDGVPWDLGLPERQDDMPFIISIDEFMASENDQITITYYEGDNTLCDEREVMIDDIDELIGETHLGMFGRGSKDPNILYVRNEVIHTDFEIIRETGLYSVVVAGMADDEPEPDTRKKRKKSERDD